MVPLVLLTRLGFVTLRTFHNLPTVHTIRIVGTAITIKHTGAIRHTVFLVVESKLLQKVVCVVKALAIFNERARRRHDGIHPLFAEKFPFKPTPSPRVPRVLRILPARTRQHNREQHHGRDKWTSNGLGKTVRPPQQRGCVALRCVALRCGGRCRCRTELRMCVTAQLLSRPSRHW